MSSILGSEAPNQPGRTISDITETEYHNYSIQRAHGGNVMFLSIKMRSIFPNNTRRICLSLLFFNQSKDREPLKVEVCMRCGICLQRWYVIRNIRITSIENNGYKLGEHKGGNFKESILTWE